MSSLIVHAENYFRPSATSYVPSIETQEIILYECEKAYQDCVWKLPDDFDTYESFERSLHRLDMTSSPGFPYQKEAPTIGKWLKWNGVCADPIQQQRLWFDVKAVMAGEYRAITRVFIKQEPHKKAKVESGRWRLIMASPLSVQIVWQMLFGIHNDREIEKSYYIPSQQGIKMVGGGWKQYLRSWQSLGLTCGVDKSSWDWTAPYWAIKLDLQLRYRLMRGTRKQDWLELAGLMYRWMFEETTIMTSSGLLFRQVVPGVMKSGCVNTISTNGHCQVFAHMAVCIGAGVDMYPLPRTCGDDTIHHEKHLSFLSDYARYGIIVKDCSETTEFVGHTFRDSGPEPLYLKKHLKKFAYISEEVLSDYLDSMARMYVHTDLFSFWEYMADVLGHPLPLSRSAYLHWYDHSD